MPNDRALRLRREVLTELTGDEMSSVAGAAVVSDNCATVILATAELVRVTVAALSAFSRCHTCSSCGCPTVPVSECAS